MDRMVKSLDQLIGYLLDEIALSGKQGMSAGAEVLDQICPR